METEITLSNNNTIPLLGFGTWQLTGDEGINAIIEAIKCGYRHIDTAQAYGNEEEVGKAVKFCIKEGIVKREDLYISSKLNFFKPIGYKNTIKAVGESLEKLKLDYIDAYLIHWPNLTPDDSWKYLNASSWEALEELHKKGLIKNLGVSNFLIHHLEQLLKTAKIKPVVNQLNLNPQWQQKEVVKYCFDNGILPVAWSANVKIENWNREILNSLAQKYNVSTNQLCYRYGLQKGWSVLARSKNPEHIKSNFNIMDFERSDTDMAKLDELNSHPTAHNQCPDAMYAVYKYEEALGRQEYLKNSKYLLFGSLPIVEWKSSNSNRLEGKATLLGFIPLFKIKQKNHDTLKVYLFNFLYLFKIKLNYVKEVKNLIPDYDYKKLCLKGNENE